MARCIGGVLKTLAGVPEDFVVPTTLKSLEYYYSGVCPHFAVRSPLSSD
jgi:hypothetical protein